MLAALASAAAGGWILAAGNTVLGGALVVGGVIGLAEISAWKRGVFVFQTLQAILDFLSRFSR